MHYKSITHILALEHLLSIWKGKEKAAKCESRIEMIYTGLDDIMNHKRKYYEKFGLMVQMLDLQR